jgi:uncharacterized protein YcbX
MPVVAGFNITPVKSTALQQPDEIELRAEGTVGDRRFICARSTGERVTGISKASLMPIRSRWDAAADRLELALGAALVEATATGNGERIEVHLFDRAVQAHHVDDAFDAFVREVAGDDTLSLWRVDEPEYGGGAHRVSVFSRASVADVGGHTGDSDLDPRRFRMLIEVDGVEPFEEDAWQGKRVRFGEAIVRMGDPMPRCVMTTLDPDSGVQNAPVLKALAEYRKVGTDLLLGVYGDVEQPGVIRIGDHVEVLD